jgi:hypothetical protein
MTKIYRSEAENCEVTTLSSDAQRILVEAMTRSTIEELLHRLRLSNSRIAYASRVYRRAQPSTNPEIASDRDRTIVNNIGNLVLPRRTGVLMKPPEVFDANKQFKKLFIEPIVKRHPGFLELSHT